LKVIGAIALVFLIWFFFNQCAINSKIKRKLRSAYVGYADSTLSQAMYNMRKNKGKEAEKDINLVKYMLNKIRNN